MTLQQLKYFVTIVRTGSINAAARELYVSQPTVTQQIRALEASLGARLFDREHQNLRLTLFGRSILQHSQEMLQLEAAIFRESRGRPRHRPLRLGSIHAALVLLLPLALAEFRERCPDVELAVQEGGTLDIQRAMSAGELDFGIVAVGSGVGVLAPVQRRTLLRSELVICLPSEWKFATVNGTARSCRLALERQPFVALSKGYLLHQVTQDYLKRSPGRTVIYTSSAEAALELVGQGIGSTILPNCVVSRHPEFLAGRVVTRPIDEGLSTWEWVIIWDQDRVLDRCDHALIEALLATVDCAGRVPVSGQFDPLIGTLPDTRTRPTPATGNDGQP